MSRWWGAEVFLHFVSAAAQTVATASRHSLPRLVAGTLIFVSTLAASDAGAQTCGSGTGCAVADATHSSYDPVIVGSPSGQVRAYSIVLRDYHGNVVPAASTWLADNAEFGCSIPNSTLVLYDGSGGDLDCQHPSCPLVGWQYQELPGNSVTFHPTFGGHGKIALQHSLSCIEGYYEFACVDARSTDINADGVTDRSDKSAMMAAIQSQSPPSWFDLNVDGRVDWSDYEVILSEVTREGTTSFQQEICNGTTEIVRTVTPFADTIPPAPIGDLSAAVSKTCALLSWTATGDDGNVGRATSYDIRYSTNQITDANFYGALQLGGVTPSLAGNGDELLVQGLASCHWYWFAIKAIDVYGHTSPISNVLKVKTLCSGSSTCNPMTAERLEPESLPADAVLLASPNPARSSSVIEYSIPAADAGRAFDVSVFNVSGRRIRVLDHGTAQAGRYSAQWDLATERGERVASGVFYVRFQLGDKRVSRAVIVTP